MSVLAVIPVRMAATRFPGKPLAQLDGRPIVQWVWEAASRSGAFDEVVVATSDDEIAECVRGFGGEVERTRADHPTGSDRVAEVAERRPDATVVVNVQGDQPFATPEMLAAVLEPYASGEAPAMATIACPLRDPDAHRDPDVVKVVCDLEGYALYFSRSPIPYARGEAVPALHHLGLYAFRRDALLELPQLEPTPLERQERLEQLRALEYGLAIKVVEVEHPAVEINTPADLDEAERLLAARGREG